jgi:hypothetical protein
MSLIDLLKLKESILYEYSIGISQGYSNYSINRLRQLYKKYEIGTSTLSEEERISNDLTSLNNVKKLVMSVA